MGGDASATHFVGHIATISHDRQQHREGSAFNGLFNPIIRENPPMGKNKMAKRKYVIEYKSKDRKTGKYDKGTMTSRVEVEAESETNAIAKMKESIAYRTSTDKKEWEVVKVTPK